MKKTIFCLFLFIPLAYGQEICPEDPDYNFADSLNKQVEDSVNWASCKVFNIEDKSVLETPKKIDSRVLVYYRQNGLILQDPIADYAVTRGNIKTFKNIVRRLLKKKAKYDTAETMDHAQNCAKVLFDLQEEDEPVMSEAGKYKDSQAYLDDKALLEELLADYSPAEKKKIMDLFEQGKFRVEPKSSPIAPNQMALELIDIIKEEEAKGLTITEGDKHRWSPEYKKTIGLNVTKQVFSIPSRILSTLGPGKSASIMVTGTEKELREFMLSRNDRSLTPNELFRRSLQINKGNVYLAILTVENILSEYWKHGKRESLAQTTKLKPLGKVFGSNGDIYGTWYHMFGIMLYGYVEGKTASTLVGKTESQGSQILSNFEEEYQENQINKNGGKVGANLRNYLRAKEAGKKFNLKPEEKAVVSVEQEIRDRVKERIAATLKNSPVEPERVIAEEKKEEFSE